MRYFQWVIVAAAGIGLSLSGHALARGVGQAEHDADNFTTGGYYGVSAGPNTSLVGQAQEDSGGYAGGYYIGGGNAGPDTSLVGQAQVDRGTQGYGRSMFYGEGRSLIAGQPEANGPVASNPRYRYADGRWWYWLPSDRWVFFDNGDWVDYNTALAQNSQSAEGSRLFSAEPGRAPTPPAIPRLHCGE